jgi:hypothetical protein
MHTEKVKASIGIDVMGSTICLHKQRRRTQEYRISPNFFNKNSRTVSLRQTTKYFTIFQNNHSP